MRSEFPFFQICGAGERDGVGSAQELGDRPGICRITDYMPGSTPELDPVPCVQSLPKGVQLEPRPKACSPVYFSVWKPGR